MPFIQDIGEDEDASPDASTILNITIARQARGEDGEGGGAAREAGAAEESAGGGLVMGTTSDVISIVLSFATSNRVHVRVRVPIEVNHRR